LRSKTGTHKHLIVRKSAWPRPIPLLQREWVPDKPLRGFPG
jgi:hypothetical protein